MQDVPLFLLTTGLLTLQFTWGQEVHTGRCSYAGVVHLEGGGRYSLNYQQALQLCQNLGYSLATEEQLAKAYNQGLKTCRYGWIEGQKMSFLPHEDHPNCSTLNSAGITSHAKEEDQLYDVYCFTHTDSLEISCEDATTLTPTSAPSVSSMSTPSELTTTTAEPEEEYDVLDEVIADGFIVDSKETTTTSVKNEILEVTHMTSTTPISLNLSGHPSQLPSLEDTTITASVTTVSTDSEAMTGEPEKSTSTSNKPKDENALTSPTFTPDQETTAFPRETSEATTAQTVSTNPGITDAPVEFTTEETFQNFVEMEAEGSGMSPETLYRGKPEDSNFPTSINTPIGDVHSTTRLLWFPEAVDGSGMEPEGSTSITPTSKGTPKPTTLVVEEPEIDEEIKVAMAKPETRAEGPGQHKGRMNLPTDPEPTTSALAEEGTPAWLIIFAFCMTLGAILCIFAGIATKDKWYGPSRRSLNITPTDESSKAATLPLSEKEQELVTLMNGGEKTDKDSTVISVEEAPEKEYLM